MGEHITVLLNEAIDGLNIKEDGIYVDATLGGGGHSSLILSKLKTGHLYSFDQDSYAIKRARERIGDNPLFTIINANFVNLKEELSKLGVDKIDGIIYDLGVSSFQFDMPERGFSYNYDAYLDMRMDQTSKLTAWEIVNKYDFNDLLRILVRYGEDPFSKQIARAIEKRRAIKSIDTTFELSEIIKEAYPAKARSKKGHPAKQTFQALRIAVNDELRVFEKSLLDAIDLLNLEGRVVIITFHSLEDRIAKTILKEKSTVNVPKNVPLFDQVAELSLVTKHPILPSEEELENNNRAHSAKMRIAQKNRR